MSHFTLGSREELEGILKYQKKYKQSVLRSLCRICGKGYHFKIKGIWTRCNKCGYSGYDITD